MSLETKLSTLASTIGTDIKTLRQDVEAISAVGYPTIRPSLNLDFANSKTVDPRITFTRASTATYYDGKTFAKAEENLLIRSQEFDTWSISNAAVTTNTTAAPDGTLTSDTLTCTASTGDHYVQLTAGSVSTLQYCFSAYVKAGTHNFVQLLNNGSSNFFANFDVGLGSAGSTGPEVTSSVVSLGSGWYRCVISGSSATLGTGWRIAFASSTAMAYGLDFAATGAESIYIWGAQLEQRSTVTAYTPTTTQPITNYIPQLLTAASDAPRIDHDPVTGVCKGLLIEEARTNLLTYSSEFDNAAWGKTNVTVQANAAVAPDGTKSGELLKSSSAGNDFLGGNATLSSGSLVTFSVYVKNSNSSTSMLMVRTTITAMGLGIVWSGSTLTSLGSMGEVLPTTYGFTPVGNGWYRVHATFTTNEINQTHRTYPDGSSAGGSIYIWGAQLEAGAFPTSYIPTATAAATRAAENASMTGTNFSSWYRQDEGTFFIENNYNSGSNLLPSNRVALSTRSAGDDRTYLYNDNSTNRYYGKAGGTTSWIAGGAAYTANFVATTASYKFNDIATSNEGAAVSTDTSAVIPSAQNTLWIGSTGSGSAYLSGYVKRIAYYGKRLSNAELQTITAA